ncbi:GNAT family N-acetyltransferase [Nocardioides sp. InS609-2]|uniref:GNAT family N-acetyltransferase n=1 Tax=Nocardioides sp. InS609-2 TaxID=2760705 RepID=UPI0020C174ED|nr:GNAT family N-acetyltransferase [Nocardioides sp. InS609-2]
MSRHPAHARVTLRNAVPDDVAFLRELWSDVLRRADASDQAEDLHTVIGAAGLTDDDRLVVAEYDGQPAGAVYLRATTVSPINLERLVQAVSPHVLPQFRRHGIGSALMEEAVGFAEDRGIGHIGAAATSASRDSNRFFARLSMGPQAVLRVATTQAVRLKLTVQRSALSQSPFAALGHTKGGVRHIDRVLAARRGRRREKATAG